MIRFAALNGYCWVRAGVSILGCLGVESFHSIFSFLVCFIGLKGVFTKMYKEKETKY